ncbi:hypothetical protein [Caudoviricetes sp.]|nr:hypothetical protein [Caudoviricetes sp.]UOF81863.1 hypothetical protein [Caudoviricetes sp.]
MTTTGERTFSTGSRDVIKPKQTLIPNGPYNATLDSGMSVGQSKERWDAVPYVNVSFSVDGTATKEGGKNRKVFGRLLLGLKPGKDGVLNVDRENGVTALSKALDTSFEGIEIVERTVTNPETQEEVKLEYLNPLQVVEALKAFEGATLGLRIGTSPEKDGYGPKNEIKAFTKAK